MRAKRTVTVLSSDIRPALPNETIRFTHKNRKNMKPEYKPFVDALIELAIREAIATLPPVQRTVFNLRYYDEMPYAEMSKTLETSEGALKASYHLAVKKIMEYLRSRD